jgi:hypothetical protein
MPNSLGRPPFAIDELFRGERSADFLGESKNLQKRKPGLCLIPGEANGNSRGAVRGSFLSARQTAKFPFHELLPSWNIRLDESQQGYRIHVRVADERLAWSPWFYFGSGGTMVEKAGGKNTKSPRWGSVNIDYLQLHKPAHYFQYRVELESPRELCTPKACPVVQRFFVSYSNTAEDELLFARLNGHSPSTKVKACRIKVPYRSQRDVSVKHLRDQICCPTCVSMVMEHLGISKETLQVAEEAYDAEYKMYGTWPRASQAAANNGLESWVQRFRTHEQVAAQLAADQPIMASIRANPGELRNARYKKTRGHLILLIGNRANGDYIVNDPYSEGPRGAEIIYARADIEKVWLDNGGVGIVIRKP